MFQTLVLLTVPRLLRKQILEVKSGFILLTLLRVSVTPETPQNLRVKDV